MAKCHDLFIAFNSNLHLTNTKRTNLMGSKDVLRTRIENWFKKNQPSYIPKFWIQGSYKMKSVIRTKDDTCDLDDGIYFLREPDVTPSTLQGWVFQAVSGHTDYQPSRRNKCVRVVFAGDYHIDYPIYKRADDNAPWLCINGGKWDDEQSDPKAFVRWYGGRKTDQLTRIVRYLKSWGDTVRHNMLSGLTMTLLAEDNLYRHEQDDEALLQTLKNIRSLLKGNWTAVMPTTPKDDVISSHDRSFRNRFFERLDAFINDAQDAVAEKSELRASKLWRKHLGDRFPLGRVPEDDHRNSSLKEIAERGTFAPYLFIDGRSNG